MPNSQTYHPLLTQLAWSLTEAPISFPATDKRQQQLLYLCDEHGLTPLVNQKLEQGFIQGLTEKTIKRLKQETASKTAFDLQLNLATKKVLELLYDKNIPVLLLKGTPVAHLFYEQSYLRTRCDTDLYINEQDVARAALVLKNHGYKITGLNNRTVSSKQFSASLADYDNNLISFDIHWKLSNRVLFADSLPFDESWQNKQAVKHLGEHAYSLSTEHLLLHACLHRIAHGRNTERNRLIWLYDIHLMIQSMSEQQIKNFNQLALNKEQGALCADAFIMSQFYFNTKMENDCVAKLLENANKEATRPLINAGKMSWVVADFLAIKTFEEKSQFLKELFFPGKQQSISDWSKRIFSKLKP